MSDDSALLCLFLCIMLDSECILFVVKCPCSSRTYDTLIIFVNNKKKKKAKKNDNNVNSDKF